MDYVRQAISDGGVTRPDDRGLMPLDEARAWLAGRDRYVRGEIIEMVDGHAVLEADRSWAALMSLADGDEFIAATRRLSWEFEVRGMENLAALQRYGEAVLVWVADRVDAGGTLRNRPWCLLPCLLACPAPAAFTLATRIRAIEGHGGSGQPAAARWVLHHPTPGWSLAADHEPTLRALVAADPRGADAALAEAIGGAAATALLGRLGLTVEAPPDEVAAALAAATVVDLPASAPVSLAELDAAFTDVVAPLYDNANYFAAAMRLTGFVVPGGQDGIVIQSLVTGLGMGNIRLEFASYGFGGKARQRWDRDIELLDEGGADALGPGDVWRLTLPTGVVQARASTHPEFGDELGPRETVMLAVTEERADRDRVFLRPDQLVEHLGLPAEAAALFTLDEWDQPAAVQPASSSVDLVLAVEALRQRRAITASVTGRSRDSHLRARIDVIGGWS